MEIDKRWLGGGLAAIAIGGAIGHALAGRRGAGPRHRPLVSDGDIQLRVYEGFATVAATAPGVREPATREGFRRLFRYISGAERAGPRIAMTAPVLVDRAGETWRTRFILPAGLRAASAPTPPSGLAVGEERLGRVVAIGFSGKADDPALADHETRLRSWITDKGLRIAGPAVYAFYNSPFMPAPLRRNEVLIPVG